MENTEKEKIVGIDLGTTNSVIAVMENNNPIVILNEEKARTTPSVVTIVGVGQFLVGMKAKRVAGSFYNDSFYSIKRFMGKNIKEISEDSKLVTYKLFEEDGKVKVKSNIIDKAFTPEDISAIILRTLASDASQYLKQDVKKAIITVPAYFNDAQRKATKEAGRIAGLDVVRIINEPTAAALAYGLNKNDHEKILIFDLGGGTFDVSILEIGDGVFEVLATSGNTHLGGDNFDQKIVEYLIEMFSKNHDVSLKNDVQATKRLIEGAEKAKIQLSAVTEAKIIIPFISMDKRSGQHIDTLLTRSKFEQLCHDLIENCRIPVEQALKDAKLTKEQIDKVVLVGGSTRIPAIQRLVKEVTGKEYLTTINPDEVVAIGAAIQAGVLSGEVKNVLLLDVTPLSLGVETFGGVMTNIISRNTTIPMKKAQFFSTYEDNQASAEINILQGENELAKDNKSLGRFELSGLKNTTRDNSKIEIIFDIDVNGILNVKAKDQESGVEKSVTLNTIN